MAACCLIGCRAATPIQKDHDKHQSYQPANTPELPTVQTIPNPVETLAIEDHPERWVYALQYQNESTDGWVRGSFDQKRNKLIIDTRNASRFRIDMTMLPINWDRLVIIRLNGKSSELRRRDSDVIDFEIDDHGNWIVYEP